MIENDRLLVLGGFTYQPEGRIADVELIDTHTSDVSCVPPDLPYENSFHASVTSHLGVITCAGMVYPCQSSCTTSSCSYNTCKCNVLSPNGQIQSFPPMGSPHVPLAMVLIDDVIYAIGGRVMEQINIRNGSGWTQQTLPVQVPSTNVCIVNINKLILVTGGNETWIYNTIANTWTEGPRMNSLRRDHACMVNQKTNTVHVMGGRDGPPHHNLLSSTEKLQLNENEWNFGEPLPEPIHRSKAVFSRTSEFVGYLAGGQLQSHANGNSRRTNKI